MSSDDHALQVLSNYVGTWDVSTTTQSPSAVGEVTGKWVLDGRFVQSNGFVKTSDGSNDFEITSLMTYDRERDVYRTWSFMSNGMAGEAESTWDPATQTMTKITRYGDATQTTTSSFSEDGVETWHMVNRDASQTVVSEMSGRNTRRSAS